MLAFSVPLWYNNRKTVIVPVIFNHYTISGGKNGCHVLAFLVPLWYNGKVKWLTVCSVLGGGNVMKDALQHALDVLSGFLAENPLVGAWYTTVVRFVFPLLALMILVGAIRSLWKVKHPDEVWGYLTLGNGVRLPLTHWENIIGRAAACDVQLEYPSVSRQHAALIRENDGSWTVYDLNSKGGIKVNDLPVDEYAIVEDGDTVSFGGIPTTMVPISAEEKRWQMAERREEGRPAGMWGSLVLLTLFQVLTAVQLVVAGGGEANVTIPLTFFVFTCVCWGYFIFMRLFRRIGFEMETIAFFLSTLSLAVTASSAPSGSVSSAGSAASAHRSFPPYISVKETAVAALPTFSHNRCRLSRKRDFTVRKRLYRKSCIVSEKRIKCSGSLSKECSANYSGLEELWKRNGLAPERSG